MFKFLNAMEKRILTFMLILAIFGALCVFFVENDSRRSRGSSRSGDFTSPIDSKDQRSVRDLQPKKIVFPLILESDVAVITEGESNFPDFSDSELIDAFESARGSDWLNLLGEMKKRSSREIVQAMLLDIDQKKGIYRTNAATPHIPEILYPVALALEEGDGEVNEHIAQFVIGNAQLEKRILGARLLLKIDPRKIAEFKELMSHEESKWFDQVLSLASSEEVLNRLFPIQVPEGY